MLCQSRPYYAGAGNADVDNGVGLAHAVKRACHERIVLGCVAEYNQLCRADTVAVGGDLGGLPYYFAHHFYGVHIDSGFGRADVDRRADKLGFAESLRNTLDQRIVSACKALLNQRGVAADKVYAELLCRLVKGFGEFYNVLALAGRGYHSNWSDRNSLVDDRYSVFVFDILAGFYKILCRAANLVVYLLASLVYILVHAVEQRNTHCDGPDVKVFVVDHIYGFKYILGF